MTPQTRRDCYTAKVESLDDSALATLAAATALALLRCYWADPLKDVYRDEVDALCREFEQRGQRAKWDEITAAAKCQRRQETKVRA